MKQPKQMQFTYGGKSYAYELYLGGVKRINLRVRPDGTIRVSAPYLTPGHRIAAFLLEYGDKIAAAVDRVQKGVPSVPAVLTKEEKARKKQALLAVISECHQALVLPRFRPLFPHLSDGQRQHILSPSAVRIRAMKTRWGSCNYAKGTLNFNLYLADAPKECIEYVIMHEFAHFVHPDHSPKFHALMDKLMPDWRERRSKLNQKTIPNN